MFTHLNAKCLHVFCSSYLANHKFHGKLAFLQVHCRKIVVILVLTLLIVAAMTVAKLFH